MDEKGNQSAYGKYVDVPEPADVPSGYGYMDIIEAKHGDFVVIDPNDLRGEHNVIWRYDVLVVMGVLPQVTRTV